MRPQPARHRARRTGRAAAVSTRRLRARGAQARPPAHGPAIVQARLHDRGHPAGQAFSIESPRPRHPGGLNAWRSHRRREAGDDPARRADRGRAATPWQTLAPGDYEIGFQRTNDILDEGMEVFVAVLPQRDGHRRATPWSRIFTADGDMVNGSCGTYLHAVIQPLIIKFILNNYRRQPGHQGRRPVVRQRRGLRRHPQPRPGGRACRSSPAAS